MRAGAIEKSEEFIVAECLMSACGATYRCLQLGALYKPVYIDEAK
jgi:hypothetical protein